MPIPSRIWTNWLDERWIKRSTREPRIRDCRLLYRKGTIMTWRKPNGELNLTKVMWTYYFIFVLPTMLVNIFADGTLGDILSIYQIIALLPFIGMLIYDMMKFRSRHKNWDRIWKEEMAIMTDFGWSQDPKKVKRLTELKEERKRYE